MSEVSSSYSGEEEVLLRFRCPQPPLVWDPPPPTQASGRGSVSLPGPLALFIGLPKSFQEEERMWKDL